MAKSGITRDERDRRAANIRVNNVGGLTLISVSTAQGGIALTGGSVDLTTLPPVARHSCYRSHGSNPMRKITLAALGAATLLTSIPAAAQELPLVGSDYWDVTSVKIDDGHFADYADFLVSDSRKQNEYAKSKGWIKAYYILSNNNARKDEPDLYLVTVSDRIPTPAEQIARNKEMNAYLQSDDRKQIAGSGHRATYRHITGDMLLQQMVLAH